MIITALAEKESQGVEYYLALSETTSTREKSLRLQSNKGILKSKRVNTLTTTHSL